MKTVKAKWPTLNQLQQSLKQEITSSHGASVLPFITEGRMSAQERVGIYSDAYGTRLFEALKTDFEATCKVLGEEDFYDLTLSYLKEFPSISTSIEEVGVKLPEFIGKHPLGIKIPYMQELATLEWNLVESFYADDLPPFDQTSLNTLSSSVWGEVKLTLDTSIKLLSTSWPILTVWETKKSFIIPEIKPALSFYLIHRHNYNVQVRAINEIEYHALSMVQEGHSVSSLCKELEDLPGEELMGIFQNWMQTGIVRSLSV